MADVVKFIILCHNRGAKGTRRPFPHESCFPTEPWETASRPADGMELACFGLHIYTTKIQTGIQMQALNGLSVLHMV